MEVLIGILSAQESQFQRIFLFSLSKLGETIFSERIPLQFQSQVKSLNLKFMLKVHRYLYAFTVMNETLTPVGIASNIMEHNAQSVNSISVRILAQLVKASSMFIT